jgi:phytoene desaturase
VSKRVAIVGAGLGGLATALRLAHQGHRVTVYEKTDQVGGRNRSVQIDGFEFDGGPTLLMMLEPFHKLFADVGEKLDDHLSLSLCDPGYRVFYPDGTRIEATINAAEMSRRIAAISSRDAAAYPRFLSDVRALYEESVPLFVSRNYGWLGDFIGPRQLRVAIRHRMIGNLAARVATYFEDPRIRALFSFQSMYLGLSPFEAPFVYSTLAYMEFGEGIWYPRGGMPEISRCIAKLAAERGAVFHLNASVRSIDGHGIILETGEKVASDVVVCNADLPYAEAALLNGKTRRKRNHSCSAYMIYAGYRGSIPELAHHNIFFGKDFKGNLDTIFRDKALPTDPAFYVSISARSDPNRVPTGCENLYLLVPCPNLDHPWTDTDGVDLQNRVFDRLERETSFDRANIIRSKTYSPLDWARELNLDKGAAFGLSHHMAQSAYFRPSNRSKHIPSLYFVGASTIPGNGMPMVLISADLACQRMGADGTI